MNSAPRRSYNSPRQLERQQRILDVARREVSRQGYDGLTMRALADAAGVALKTLYNLYSSKDELLFAAVGGLLEDLRSLPEVLNAEPGIPRGLTYVAVLAETIVREPAYADAMARALFQAAPEHRLVEILLRDGVEVMQENLSIAAQNLELEPQVSTGEIATQLVAAQWGVVLLWQKGLVPLADIPQRMQQSQLPILLAATRGKRRRWLEAA